MSYHVIDIHKHSHTSPFKLQEEFFEYLDAVASKNKVMAIQELSDIYCCLENEASKFNIEMSDLKVMADTTRNVFQEGYRVNDDLLSYLRIHHDSIVQTGLGFIQVKVGDFNYNFYHKDLEVYKDYKKPHSHKRSYVSEILKGSLTEKLYRSFQGPIKSYSRCGDKQSFMYLDSELKSKSIHKATEIYVRLKEEFHTVKGSHGTITKVMKFGSKTDAYVISDKKSKPLSKVYTYKELWDLVKETYSFE